MAGKKKSTKNSTSTPNPSPTPEVKPEVKAEAKKNGNGNGKAALEQARERIKKVMEELDARIVGHADLHRVLVVSLVAHTNIVMVGPPGTAKPYTVKTLAKQVDAEFYACQLTKTMTDYDVLGYPDFKKLREAGEIARRWTRIIESDVVFFDEVFKASDLLLEALLSILEERIVYDLATGQEVPTNIKLFVGASNEIPEDEELQAVYDRFPVRVFVDYIQTEKDLLAAIRAYWLNPRDIKPVATMKDVEALHEYAIEILTRKIKDIGYFVDVVGADAVRLVLELRRKGIIITDRTVVNKLMPLVASYCAIFGLTRENIANAVFELLPWLGRDRDEQKRIRDEIMNTLGEVAEMYKKLEQAKKEAKAGNLKTALELCEQILQQEMAAASKNPIAAARARVIAEEAYKLKKKIEEQLKQIEEL